MNTLKRLLVAVLCVTALGSIGASKARRSYLKVHDHYTVHSLVYFKFQTAINTRATLLTPEMREALMQERVRLMSPPAENTEAFRARMLTDQAAYHEVIFAVGSGIDGAHRLGTTDAEWNVRLSADGTPEELITIEHVRHASPVHRALYPQLNQWSELWIARFKRTVQSPKKVELVIGSGFGNDTLVWSL